LAGVKVFDSNPDQTVPAYLQNLVSGYPTRTQQRRAFASDSDKDLPTGHNPLNGD
jgi:hypothetical protein